MRYASRASAVFCRAPIRPRPDTRLPLRAYPSSLLAYPDLRVALPRPCCCMPMGGLARTTHCAPAFDNDITTTSQGVAYDTAVRDTRFPPNEATAAGAAVGLRHAGLVECGAGP